MAELPPLPDGFVVNHFITSDDVERSARFYTEVLGGIMPIMPGGRGCPRCWWDPPG